MSTLKKVNKYLLWFSFFLMLAVLSYITVNLWPRDLEPKLWSKNELAFKENPKTNGWNALPKRGDKRKHLLKDAPLIVDDLSKFWNKDSDIFWNEVTRASDELSSFINKHQKSLRFCRTFFEYPDFIDSTPVSFEKGGFGMSYLRDLHTLGYADIINKALNDEWAEAYDFWRNIFRQDLSWLKTARSVLSHVAAVKSLNTDIRLLSHMWFRYGPDPEWKVIETIEALDLSDVSFRKALIYEYHMQLLAFDTAELATVFGTVGKILKPVKTLLIPCSFNRALYRRDLNNLFREYEQILSNPDNIADDFDDELFDDIDESREGLFWWYVNPGGKLLRGIVTVGLAKPIKDFYKEKKEIEKQIHRLLGNMT